MGAMTIVELIDANEGFGIITQRIRSTRKETLLWIVGWLTFFLSSVLDNLTTTIVMVTLLRKLIADPKDRMLFAGLVVIAANAGGAWTVIGDVTTTMLWIKGKISTIPVMKELFLASATCLLVPLIGMTLTVRGPLQRPTDKSETHLRTLHQNVRTLFLVAGLGGLLFVPVFKAVTHLPPYLGMMFSLSMLWVLSEVVHRRSDEQTRSSTGLVYVLKKIDMSSVLFFLGILLAVGCLDATGTLRNLASVLNQSLGNVEIAGVIQGKELVAILIGLVSAIVDNVPLVAAGIGMYTDPIDSPFWMLLAYCAGTGGSCLIIGSAAGVAAMGLEHISFFGYLRRVSFWALIGYLSGVAVFLVQLRLLGPTP
jgi:Na+/H+ antiporter NhaD/arsenite permease-like protein